MKCSVVSLGLLSFYYFRIIKQNHVCSISLGGLQGLASRAVAIQSFNSSSVRSLENWGVLIMWGPTGKQQLGRGSFGHMKLGPLGHGTRDIQPCVSGNSASSSSLQSFETPLPVQVWSSQLRVYSNLLNLLRRKQPHVFVLYCQSFFGVRVLQICMCRDRSS